MAAPDTDDIVYDTLRKLKSTGATSLSDTAFRTLELCFSGDGGIFDRSCETIDMGGVVRVETPGPVKRFLYQVQSSLPKGKSERGPHPSEAGHHADTGSYRHGGGYSSSASGIDDAGYYTVLPHYCTCVDYNSRVLLAPQRKWCKHLLAAAIADAIGKYQIRVVTPTDFGEILKKLFEE